MRGLACLGIVAALVAAGCGSDADEFDGTDSTPSTTVGKPGTTPPTSEPPRPSGDEPTASEPPAPQVQRIEYGVAFVDDSITDSSRNRTIPYRVFAPVDAPGATPVVLVSHGGQGNALGWTRGHHLGETLARRGFIAIHVGHLSSPDVPTHVFDRPDDISIVLDRLAAGDLELPESFVGAADLERVGHTGHSFGAYTSHAVGGATFTHGTHADPRIDAIAPISPQGVGGLGGFDNGDGDNTWSSVTIPTFDLVGGDETDTNAIGSVNEPDWRLTPFRLYNDVADRYLTVIDGQDHEAMYENGPDEVKTYVAEQIATFFEVYVAGFESATPCEIGAEPGNLTVTTSVLASPDGPLAACGAGTQSLTIDGAALSRSSAVRVDTIRI